MISLRIKTKDSGKNTMSCVIKSEKANMSEAMAAIKALRDYILQNEEGIMGKEKINETIMQILEKEKE